MPLRWFNPVSVPVVVTGWIALTNAIRLTGPASGPWCHCAAEQAAFRTGLLVAGPFVMTFTAPV